MGGGWVGYIFSIFGCGLVLALFAGSTLLLYGYARLRKGAAQGPRGVVKSVSSRGDGARAVVVSTLDPAA